MVDLLAQGAAWLGDQLKQFAGRPIIYLRQEELGGAPPIPLIATVGATEFEQTNDYGVVHRIESRDYLVLTADLVESGAAIVPQAGDQITEDDGTKTYTYEVMAPGDEPCWRWSDRSRTRRRIHTNHVGTAVS